MKNYILTGTLCMFLFGGCGEHAHDHEHEGHDHEAEIHAEEKTAHSDEIVLTPEKAEAAGVEAEVVHPGSDTGWRTDSVGTRPGGNGGSGFLGSGVFLPQNCGRN